MGKLCVLAAILAGCGRYGFTDSPPATPDATLDASSTDGGPTQTLACGSPTRFQVGASAVSALTATGMANGFTLFTTDVCGGLHGWGYQFEGTSLVAKFENTSVDTGANGGFRDPRDAQPIPLAA